MLTINMLKRKAKDFETATKCDINCLCCPVYTTVKEMNIKCEIRKAKARIINRQFREFKG